MQQGYRKEYGDARRSTLLWLPVKFSIFLSHTLARQPWLLQPAEIVLRLVSARGPIRYDRFVVNRYARASFPNGNPSSNARQLRRGACLKKCTLGPPLQKATVHRAFLLSNHPPSRTTLPLVVIDLVATPVTFFILDVDTYVSSPPALFL